MKAPERGSASALALVLIGLGVVLAVALVVVGLAANARARATVAADAAALAAAPATFTALGLGDPQAAAVEAASLNGARLIECGCQPNQSLDARTAVVRVTVDLVLPIVGPWSIEAASAARFEPVSLVGQ